MSNQEKINKDKAIGEMGKGEGPNPLSRNYHDDAVGVNSFDTVAKQSTLWDEESSEDHDGED